VTLRSGDALLYAVSARRSMAWKSFSAVIDATFVPGHQSGAEMKYLRSGAARVGEVLGHWDAAADEQNAIRVYVAPTLLARLPWPGLPRAVVCGSRSPDTARAAHASAGAGEVRVHTVTQSSLHPYAPSRIEVCASSDDGLQAFASDLGIQVAVEPPAWGIAQVSSTVSDYLESLDWRPDDGLDWPRRDFDRSRLVFGPARDGRDGGALRLGSYTHPRGWKRIDRLYREGQFAAVERSWGRYAVLAAASIVVLRYDPLKGTVSVPRQLPLPRLLARAFSLCSGRPPAVVPGDIVGRHLYGGVPEGIFRLVAEKLDQRVRVHVRS
jgi:hypothetical protein